MSPRPRSILGAVPVPVPVAVAVPVAVPVAVAVAVPVPVPVAVALALVAVLVAVPVTANAVPIWPVSPQCGVDGDLSTCPPEAAGDWTLWGHTPESIQSQIRPDELEMGIGNGVLPAWRLSTGSWDSIVAVADSGIKWQEVDLAGKIFLNVAELPVPRGADGVDAASHDFDGNGVVNVFDYAEDPRVAIDAGDWRSHHMLEPSDLIHTFSDGVDDDNNGYIDDIAGWDVFENDNDPFATNESSYGDHGTGVMEDAAGEAGNGGDVGVCPSCSVLPIRVGDSFITTGNHAADALLFALTHRAASISMAIGGLTNPPLVREVMALARDEGLFVVAVAGDETSIHRNMPAVNDGALYVHSIGADAESWEEARSFLRFVNCNNLGPRMDLVAATKNSCATGASARIAGGAALLQALAVEKLGRRLTVDELRQVLTQNAADIDVVESRGEGRDLELYPSFPGWDQSFGYGRMDLGAAARAIDEGRIPPTVRWEGVDWFEYMKRATLQEVGFSGSGVPRVGTVSVRAAEGSTWNATVGVGYGSDPGFDVTGGAAEPATGYESLLEFSGAGASSQEVSFDLDERYAVSDLEPVGPACQASEEPSPLAPETYDRAFWNAARFDPAYTAPRPLPSDGVLGKLGKLDPYGVTVVATVEDDAGNVAEARRHVYPRDDRRLLLGFPARLPASVEGSPALFDFDGDGGLDIVVADSGGLVHVIDGDGEPRAGWPQAVDLAPATDPDHADGHTGAWPFADGHLAEDLGRQDIVASVAVAPLDGGSGPPDVVASTLSGFLYAWRADGSLRDGFPVSMDFANCDPADRDDDHRTDCGFFATPTLADLDGDGALDIIQPGMDQWLYVWDRFGDPLPGWPAFVQDTDSADLSSRVGRILSSVAVGDLEGDGDLELVLGTSQTAGSDFGGYGMLYGLDTDGSLLPGWPVPLFAGYAGALPYVGEGVVVSPALADFDGDGDLEVIANAVADAGQLRHHDGTTAATFRATRQHFGDGSNTDEPSVLLMAANPIVSDGNGDGVPDIFAGGSGINYGGNLLVWRELFDHDHVLMGYDGVPDEDGRMRPLEGFPQQVDDLSFFGGPAAADLDGDGVSEVIHGTTLLVRAFSGDGSVPPGDFPLFHGGWQSGATSVGDVDGDGCLDIVVATREGYLFAWSTDGDASGHRDWPMLGHDSRRTGNWHTPLRPQSGVCRVVDEDDIGENGCAVEGDGSGRRVAMSFALPGLLVLLLLAARRRRG